MKKNYITPASTGSGPVLFIALIALILIALPTDKLIAGDTLVNANSSWKYLDNGSDQGSAWRKAGFVDDSWKSGNAELGYGDGNEATVVSYGGNASAKYITTYFRKTFNVTDKSLYTSIDMSLIRDDGAIVYINGNEVYRTNITQGTVGYKTLASTSIGNPAEATYNTVNLNPGVLVNGSNFICVEIHQVSATDSDISFKLKLFGNTGNPGCIPPSGLVASSITTSSAKLDWSAISGALTYKIFYRKSGSSQWLYTGSKINSKSVYGLLPSTSYEFQVQTACNSTNASITSTIGKFTTKSYCSSAPKKLFASSVEPTSAVLSWSDISSTVGFNVNYQVAGSGVWKDTTSLINSVKVVKLKPGTNYEFKVVTNCGASVSPTSIVYGFTTPTTTPATTTLNVYANSTASNLSSHAVGINMNYLLDDDTYLNPAISTNTALKNMGVKFLRFPGGEKADSYLWATPPFTSANHTLARTGPFEWPATDYNFVNSDYKTLKSTTLNFDEFIVLCKSVGADPIIVVSYDGMYGQLTPGGTRPTKDQLLTTAAEWVKYANITKGYGIKYWMIGNESYNTNLFSYNGNTTKEQYRDDIILFSQKMKAVDPSIKIIANGEQTDWWQTVLAGASPYIDYLGVNNFPVWQYTGGYDYYKNNVPALTTNISKAVNAIYAYAPAAHQNRLKVIVTEFNSMDWEGSWESFNDLGHAMVSFEICGEQLKNQFVEGSTFWNTRWVDNDKMTEIAGALDKSGNTTANGKAISIWGGNIGDKMVTTTATSSIRTFASVASGTNKLYVYMINKGRSKAPVKLALTGYVTNATGKIWSLKGTGPFDKKPTWSQTGTTTLAGTSLSLTLEGVSITMVELTPGTSAKIGKEETPAIVADGFYHTDLDIYPNPTTGSIHVEYAQNPNTSFTISVYNVNGQVVYKNDFVEGMDEFIDLNNQPTGIYFIQMRSDKTVITKKIILNR